MKVYTYDALELNGRLGNQLWQIAATINLAEQNDGIARFKPDWSYRQFFSVPDEYFEPIPEDAERVDGGHEYFQEYRYFEPIADKIRAFYEPSNLVVDNLDESRDFFDDIEQQFGITAWCAIHVRRGDYLKHPNHFPIMTPKYFSAAIEDVVTRHYRVGFRIFSDDMDWCKENREWFGFHHSDVVVFEEVNKETPVEVVDRVDTPTDQFDLFAIASCDEHIISNSTFSWWGAYLSGNPSPIYPNKWFGRGVPNWQRWEHAIPEGWRKFPC
jgi:hypothetical protein